MIPTSRPFCFQSRKNELSEVCLSVLLQLQTKNKLVVSCLFVSILSGYFSLLISYQMIHHKMQIIYFMESVRIAECYTNLCTNTLPTHCSKHIQTSFKHIQGLSMIFNLYLLLKLKLIRQPIVIWHALMAHARLLSEALLPQKHGEKLLGYFNAI